MLSIIVPVYNKKIYIQRLFQSFFAQTYTDIELIIIDDGSVDNSYEECKIYSSNDSRVKIIQTENGGAIKARMKGLELAKGDYVTFLDADDWVEKSFYSDLMAPISEDSNIDIVIGSYKFDVDGIEEDVFGYSHKSYLDQQTALLLMFSRCFFDWAGCGKVYRRDLFTHIEPWWSYISYGDDTEMNWKLIHQANIIYYIPSHGYHYCMNGDSLMHSADPNRIEYYKRMEILRKKEERNIALVQQLIEIEFEQLLRDLPYFVDRMSGNSEKIEFLWRKLHEDRVLLGKPVTNKQRWLKKWHNYTYSEAKRFFEEKQNEIVNTCKHIATETGSLYIYGAGQVGTNLVVLLEKNGIVINGFIESKKKRDRHYGYNVYEIQELYNPCISMGIVLALNEKNALEVKKELKTRNLRNIKSEDLSWAQDYILHKSLTDWL